jgi:hypothetical protein
MEATIQWKKMRLKNTEKHFMGDLCTTPIYSSDLIVLNHAKAVIDSFPKKSGYYIEFYISKTIGEMLVCNDTCGSF